MRGPTGDAIRNTAIHWISIPRPLARPDAVAAVNKGGITYFNSQASCEARPLALFLNTFCHNFNSQASCEARRHRNHSQNTAGYFNSQASCEARRCRWRMVPSMLRFQFPGLLRGPTAAVSTSLAPAGNFNSQASCEARPRMFRYRCSPENFNSQASCEARRSWFIPHLSLSYISIPRPLARPDCRPE